MDKVKLKLIGISEIVGLKDIVLLALVDENDRRQLIVTCDTDMRKQIQLRMMDRQNLDNRYPEVMASLLKTYGHQNLEVLIKGQRDGEYITVLCDSKEGREWPIRCSDGILFSLISECPLFATFEVMLRQSVPFLPGSTKVALPINVITDEMLQTSLSKAIECEDYEMASNLRDELKKRHSKDLGHKELL